MSDDGAGPTLRDLARFEIFAPLDRRSLSALAGAVQRRSWVAGQTIFQRGDDGTYLIAVTTGRVRLSLGSPQGRELVLRHVEAGQVTGELALIDGEARSADAVAVEAVTALTLARPHFDALVAAHPDVGLAFARHVTRLLRATNYQMESIALYDLQSRLVRFLLLTLRQKHGEDLPPRAELRLGLNQSDLSAVLGASRPKVNQAMQALVATGAVAREGDILSCDVERLGEMAGDEI